MPISSWEEFVTALEGIKSEKALFAAHVKGPVLPLHTVNFTAFSDLDFKGKADVIKLIKELVQGTKIVDASEKKDSRNSDRLGAMRQIHGNSPSYLPPHDAKILKSLKDGVTKGFSSKALLYNQYAVTNKKHTNDQGGGSDPTGFVEYTAGTNGLFPSGNRLRIVFDYVNSRIFLSPCHYASWAPATNPTQLLDKPKFGDACPNPFYLINF